MNTDISITQIINVYGRNNIAWNRKQFAERQFDAVVFFLSGKIEYRFETYSVTAKAGDVLLLPRGIPYSGKCHTVTASYYVIDFICLEESQFRSFGAPYVFSSEDSDETLRIFKKMNAMWEKQLPSACVYIKMQIYSLLNEAISKRERTPKASSDDKLISFILENISDPTLTVGSICKHFYISDSQVRRYVHKRVGLSPNEYIVSLRINMAKNLLATTNKTIKTISFECGFSSPYYFSRCFSKVVGVSPSEYKKLADI